MIGLINLDAKGAGARSAGNPHAACDVAGAGNGLTMRLVRHSQRKRGERIGRIYGAPRQSPTLPPPDFRKAAVAATISSMERSSFDVIAELMARDLDPELLRRARDKTPTERIIWLEEMQAFADDARKARTDAAERAPRPAR